VEGDALLERHVLLAEDGPDNQRLISMLLRRAGATVTLAQNGQEALEAVEARHGSHDFDLILMDMQMPIVDGYSAARKLRESGCGVPIIALTAHAMQGDREKCLAAGCSDYLTKPVDRQSLLAMAVKYLQPLPLSAVV
jgi:CheY-like chemotaxis protein